MPRTSQVELPGCPPFRALCCDNLGYMKVVESEAEKGTAQVVSRWGQPGGNQLILCTSLSGDTQPGFAVARKNGRVEVLHPVSGVLLAELGVPTTAGSQMKREDASDAICGLHLFKKTSFWGTSVLTCTEEGVVAIQGISYQDREGDENMGVSTSSGAGSDVRPRSWSVSDSGCVLCLQVDGSERYAIFGGKGVDVNIWDLQECSQIWSAKSPRRDSLGLIAPPYVTALTFLSDNDHRKFVVGTGHHQIRLYDAEVQRRPMMMIDYGESPIKSLTSDVDGYTVYVGTGNGDLACFDMRTGQNVGGFKGKISGSIRSVCRHPTLPLIASCGLDRYIRIHHSKTRRLLAMLFLKQQLVNVVFDTSTLPCAAPSESAEKGINKKKVKETQMIEGEVRDGNQNKSIEKADDPSNQTLTKKEISRTSKPEGLNKLSKTIKKSRKSKSSGS